MDEYRMIDSHDFSDLVRGLWTFMKQVLRFVFGALRRYFILASVVGGVVAAIGYHFWRNAHMYYKASMVCTCPDKNRKVYGEMLHDLDRLARTGSSETLAACLHIPLETAKRVAGIDGKNMAGSHLYEDITENHSPVYVEVIATDSHIFPLMGTSILNYLNSSTPYLYASSMSGPAGSIEVIHDFVVPEQQEGDRNRILQMTLLITFVSSFGTAIARHALKPRVNS